MALTNAQYQSIFRAYEEQQLRNRKKTEDKIRYLNTHVDGYQELSRKISSFALERARSLLSDEETSYEEWKASFDALISRRDSLLKEAGLDPSFLSIEYQCKDCQDTGYIGQEKCHCFKQRIITLLYEQSNIKELLEENNFSRLRLDFYQGEDLSRFENAVCTCHGFIDSFSLQPGRNLFFYGTVGTGKSFLSGCIARELIEKGFSVIYFSAGELFERISRHSFDYRQTEELQDLNEDLYTCDLLIIDDLGTELTTAFSSSRFFACLNERLLRKKSVIISTNLSLQELRDRYSDRIFSRITSNFDLCKITGPDIRMYQKRMQNRK